LLKASSLFLNFSASENRLDGILSGIYVRLTIDHALDFSRGQLADRVGDGDVGAAARGLLSGSDLKDTVDVDLKDNFKDGITSLHGRDRGKGELSERGVILAVHTLTLENRELDGLPLKFVSNLIYKLFGM
jgi:NAD-specific glutamate dehydrogenase